MEHHTNNYVLYGKKKYRATELKKLVIKKEKIISHVILVNKI